MGPIVAPAWSPVVTICQDDTPDAPTSSLSARVQNGTCHVLPSIVKTHSNAQPGRSGSGPSATTNGTEIEDSGLWSGTILISISCSMWSLVESCGETAMRTGSPFL